jgi:hypothetical protein
MSIHTTANNSSTSYRPVGDPAKTPVRVFSADDAALVIRNVATARAIFRVVALAAKAQSDGVVSYENNTANRWRPALDEAMYRLQAVRNVLMESSAAPDVDWVTSLALVEAIGAALWNDSTASKADPLDEIELETLAQAVIESLDAMLDDCTAGGVHELARGGSSSVVH